MKSLRFLVLLGIFHIAQARDLESILQDGDILFTGGPSGQGLAIMQLTASPITHCGVAFRDKNGWQVLEAVQPVRTVPVRKFTVRKDHKFLGVFRLKKPLSARAVADARQWGVRQIGKNYDAKFLWNNERIYCSELVWKMFESAGVRLCEPRKFKDYFLDRPAAQELIAERFGGKQNLPLDEKVVAPADIAASALLKKVDY